MRENIHYSKTISTKIIPYIEEAISILESINIPITEDITFNTERNENRIIKDKSFAWLPLNELLPYVMLNERVVCKLVKRYLIGNYDNLLNTPNKCSRFVSILELPISYDDTKELNNLIGILNSRNEMRFQYA